MAAALVRLRVAFCAKLALNLREKSMLTLAVRSPTVRSDGLSSRLTSTFSPASFFA